jgi:predicted N-acyltransferase
VRARCIPGIEDVDAARWNALVPPGALFVRHEFLAAIERSGSVGRSAGWEPRHLLLESADGALVAALPLYLKWHSYGEFVFDFSWAQAYRRHGLDYYPKLVSCVPFTPATQPHLLTGPSGTGALRAALLTAARELATTLDASSLHLLFAAEEELESLRGAGFMPRTDCQFHWRNRGWPDFEAYLASFTAEKRKKTRRERRRVAEQGIHFETLHGAELLDGPFDTVMDFYTDTFLRHGHEPYLNRAFFRDIARTLPDRIMVKLAVGSGRPVGAAIFFRGDDTLYGRYWGANGAWHSLHFETCYHQGIDYCLEHGLARFEPGTQGEHKLARGFRPTRTWSAHHVRDPRFAEAIDRALATERGHVENYLALAAEHVPYRREEQDLDVDAPTGLAP